MTSNLLIGYPEIPALGTLSLVSDAEDTPHPLKNIISGSRADYFQTAADSFGVTVKVDLGASLTKAVDYFFLGGANILLGEADYELLLDSSPDDVTYTTRLGVASLAAATRSGRNDEDIIVTASLNNDLGSPTSTAFRYWRYILTGSGGRQPHRKAYFGSLFDFGLDPIYPASISRLKNSPGERAPSLRFDLEWRGITNAKVTTFRDEIYKKRDVYPVVLYASSYDYMINNQTTCHARIASGSFTPESHNSNRVNLSFQELI